MRSGLDPAPILAFVLVPPVAAVLWLLLLSGRVDPLAAVVVWVLFFFALRPLIWLWASERESTGIMRSVAYKERQRASVNTSFLAGVLVGLGALDVLRLPGAPYWKDQPRASFALVAVVIYLVWLAQSANIPHEVATGYRSLFGRKD